MAQSGRQVDVDLRQSWEQATSNPDPMSALRASRELYHRLSSWQVGLVAEALAGGATWEDVGEARGATRQAAWSRFNTLLGSSTNGGKSMNERVAQVRDESRQELANLHAQLSTGEQELRD